MGAMLSMEPLDGDFGVVAVGAGGAAASCISVRIIRTEEQVSLMMQRFTAYVMQVNEFGQTVEVSHRYGDFESLHRSLLTDCPGLRLPPMPPKGVDGTDVAVIKGRKVELEKLMQAMLGNAEVLMEKNLHIWKFLELPNPTVIATRFVAVPRSRHGTFRTLVKLVEPKYKDDVFRLGNQAVVDLLLEGLRELRQGDPGGSHWVNQQAGRQTLCQLLGGALSASEAARSHLLEADVIGNLLGLVERDETALDDARIGLNVIVAREGDRLDSFIAAFLRRGGLSQLAVLVQRDRCQEFVAKLLWLAWEAPVRSQFAQPGGQGLRILQALLRSLTPTCALLGAVLLAGLIAGGDFDAEVGHRSEAVKLVKASLSQPEAAADPQFCKTLCGANSALVRLAALLEDADLAPLVLGLLCAAKPPPSKLSRISGNLAALVSDKGGLSVSEETKARAAELLLHVQSAGAEPAAVGTANGGRQAARSGGSFSGGDPLRGGIMNAGGSSGGGAAAPELERCEGIAEHEASLDAALRRQLEDGVLKSQQALHVRGEAVREAAELARHRLGPLPGVSFQHFDQAFASFKLAREKWGSKTREGETLLHDMERQLIDLRTARPSTLDPHIYKERLLSAERIYADVKSQREVLAAAEVEAREKQSRADETAAAFRRASDAVKRLEDELSTLRLKRSEKETEAIKLRHKANTPNLDAMKQQAAASIERSLQQAKELQVIGQRVQQGDPDYLREGENRDQKIAELASKLSNLKKQHQVLLQQQKDLDFDPISLSDQASRLEREASEMAAQTDSLEFKRMEADRERATKITTSSVESQEARSAQDRKQMLSSQLAGTEAEARRQMNLLQPMIQEHHGGWQRLLAQQKKLDADSSSLTRRLEEAQQMADTESIMRSSLAERLEELIGNMLDMRTFLQQVGGDAPPSRSAPPLTAAPGAAGGRRAPAFDDDEHDPFAFTPAAAPALVAPPASKEPALPVVSSKPVPAAQTSPLFAAAASAPAAAAGRQFEDYDDFDFDLGGRGKDASAAPAPAATPATKPSPSAAATATAAPAPVADDFDDFLREEPQETVAASTAPLVPEQPGASYTGDEL